MSRLVPLSALGSDFHADYDERNARWTFMDEEGNDLFDVRLPGNVDNYVLQDVLRVYLQAFQHGNVAGRRGFRLELRKFLGVEE